MSAPAREDTDRLKKKRETLVDNCSVSHLTGEVMRKSQMTCLKSCETATNPRTVLRPAVTFVLQGLLHAHLSSRYMARCTPIQHFLSSNTRAHWKKQFKESWGSSANLTKLPFFLPYQSHWKERIFSVKEQCFCSIRSQPTAPICSLSRNNKK